MSQAQNIARSYFRRLGKDTTSAESDATAQFVEDLSDIGVLHLAADAWSLRSAFNVGSGSTVRGLLGRSNITLTNSPTWGTSGITFNGTNQSGSATLPATQTTGTLIAVFASAGSQPTNFAVIAALPTAAGRATGGTGGQIGTIGFNNQSAINCAIYDGTTSLVLSSPTYLYYGPADARFRMYAITNGSTTASGGLTQQVDGCLASQMVDNFPTPGTNSGGISTGLATVNAVDRVTVASSWSGAAADLFFNGTISFVMVFTTQLTETQIQAIYVSLRKTICAGLAWTRNVFIDGDSQAAADGLGLATDKWHNKLLLTASQRWYGKIWMSNTNTVSGDANIPATGGQTSVQRLAAYDALCPGQKPIVADDKSYYILCVGINDIGISLLPAADTFLNIQALLGKAKRDGMKTILFGLPDWINYQNERRRKEFKALQSSIAAFGGSPGAVDLYVPLDTRFGRHNYNEFIDGVHLNAASNTWIADYIYAAIPNP